MKPNCPNFSCQNYLTNARTVKDGSFFRKDDSRKIARFKCTSCLRRFSAATSTLEYRHKKRRINHQLFKLLASGMSLRRAALFLEVHQVTIQRKFIYLAEKSRKHQQEFLLKLKEDKVDHMQFDDLITTEHSKLKPLSISLAVDAKRRFILGAEVSRIPAFGKLAGLSRKKYGKRISGHKEKLSYLFSKIYDVVEPSALIESDEHMLYPQVVDQYFPKAKYIRYKGGRGCIVGQGELKKLHYDPLFKLNHTCAMFRANINRLFRRTWCTTKRPDMLKNHIDIYIHFHNQYLLKH